ncbi:UDP-N-acetylglucosamine 1-carboxyvinyltransferase 2-like [Salvia hispanica]|uniref:UDP-N-acetylglucosamine 1-carboxyvinyltransferase 2-like n=1 Tax=Salvia hispanica TaxID=49212 RepID=UPI002009C9F6|nr:UDP-N-acetylglucosamine 1-carboxyvinyltransferase 2-like [Salvia hispanica]XP_047956355.1 UDP-N-acetylglucosamine 1-carboxyvinyltransferase 2-like [Salvia hispanica]XP_047956356.1 UDP-N-acetylglucosamine 1-carboxyvinyltransferase 2-like [Salvia hispanica]
MSSKFDPFLPLNPNLILPHPNPPPNSPHLPAAPPAAAKLVITGGNSLSGHAPISGSKNSALAILAATLCCRGDSRLSNVPQLIDTTTMAAVLSSLGAEIEFSGNNLVVRTERVGSVEPDAGLVGRIRGGFFVVGPLLARFGEAAVGLPGGCDIGARPVDIYVRGLRELGAVVELRDNKLVARAANGRGLVGGRFRLDYPSVGATQTLMMAACLAEGTTLLSNVAREPEIADLASFLTSAGARVEGVGTDKIRIHGTRQLYGAEHAIMPDRIEAGTFMLAAAITRSRISLSPVWPELLSVLIDKLSGAGCTISHMRDELELSAIPRRSGEGLRGFDVRTLPYPGFPTDLQPQTMAMLSTCDGLSIVEESVFENRLTHVKELQKFGAKIYTEGSTAFIHGKGRGEKLRGARVDAADLRGGMSLVLAGLAAEGVTQVSRMSNIDRGYESLETKLRSLGADVKRLEEPQSILRS